MAGFAIGISYILYMTAELNIEMEFTAVANLFYHHKTDCPIWARNWNSFFHIFGIFWDKNLMGKLSRNILSALLLPLVHGDQALQVTSCNDENSLVSFPTSISKYYLYGFRDQHFRCEFRNHTLKTIYLVKTVSRWTVVITRKLLTERSFS